MKKQYPIQTREEILTKIHNGDRVSVLANQYGISSKTIYGWLHKSTGEDVVSKLKYNKLKRENDELKKLVGELTLNMNLEKKS